MSALYSLRLLREEVRLHGDHWAQVGFGFSIPSGIGLAIAWWLLPAALTQTDKASMLAVAAGVLAFAAILVGFVVTLMLFTGRIELPSSAQVEVVAGFADRTRYLLYSQAVTLFAATILSALVILFCIMVAAGSERLSLLCIGLAIGGFTSMCLFRACLLPLQIYEIHVAGLQMLIDKAQDELSKKYS